MKCATKGCYNTVFIGVNTKTMKNKFCRTCYTELKARGLL